MKVIVGTCSGRFAVYDRDAIEVVASFEKHEDAQKFLAVDDLIEQGQKAVEILSFLRPDGSIGLIVEKLRAALAKARGES